MRKWVIAGCIFMGLASAVEAADVTFYSYGDCHYGADAAETNWVYRINALAGTTLPAAFGGDVVAPARGVIALGDLINEGGNLGNGTNQWNAWKADYGVNKEGVCMYPVYENFGNHDLSASRFVQKDIITRNLTRPGLTAVSTNGLHYSWDWDGVHFVALGVYPADTWTTENTFSAIHNPEYALSFLKWDLENNVGDSGRPVILTHHYDFFTDWWPAWQKLAYPRELNGYNVVLILHGHQGAAYGYNFQGYTAVGQNGSLNVVRITTNNMIQSVQSTGLNTWGLTYQKSFTMPDLGRTWNPAPRNNNRNVLTNLTQLSWRTGAYVVTQDVYFGTSSGVVAAATSPAIAGLDASVTNCAIPAAYLPLQPNTEYFWRVDQANGDTPFSTGKVWSFKTQDCVRTNDVTFLFVSDIHYQDETLTANKNTVLAMNSISGTPYPTSIGGSVETPRGVVFGGDSASEAKQWQYNLYLTDYGLTADKLLQYPVAGENNGNHDGGLGSVVANGIVARNRTRTNLTAISTNGLHCSWDWDGVHFVTLGVRPGVNTNPYNSHGSLEFLIGDLSTNVANSGKAVVLFQHFGVDDYAETWWTDAERAAYYDAIKNYNVIGIFHGHTHTVSIYKWQGIDVFHAPHMQFGGSVTVPVNSSQGFFAVHITSNRMTVAERKADGTWGLNASKPIYLSYDVSGLPAVVSNGGGATNLTATSAVLNGGLLYEAVGASPTSVTVYWGPTDGATNKTAWTNAVALGSRSAGGFSTNISGLKPGRTYYYRSTAANSAGEVWASETAVFQSGDAVTLSNTNGATEVTMANATLNGTLVDMATTPTEVFVCWGITDGGTNKVAWTNWVSLGTLTPGLFSTRIGGLQPNRTYFYRTFATNILGEAWSLSSSSFMTLPPVVLNNGAGATTVSRVSAVLNGELVQTYSSPTEAFICWGPNDGGMVQQAWSNQIPCGVTPIGLFSSTVSTLSSDTRYYYRVYATNSAGDGWASVTETFTTLSSRPIITNQTPTGVIRSVATLNGMLVSTGSAPTRVFACWGTTDGGTNSGSWARNEDLGVRNEGTLGVTVTGLTPGQQYAYRFLASNTFGVAWAPTSSVFTTLLKTGPFYTWDAGGAAHSPADWNDPTNWVGDNGFPNGVGQGARFESRITILDHEVFRLNGTITVGEVRFLQMNAPDEPSKKYIDSFGLSGAKMIFATEDGEEAEFRYENSGDTRRLLFQADMVLSNNLHYLNYQNRAGAGIAGIISGPGRLRIERYRGSNSSASDFSLGTVGAPPNTFSGGTVLSCGAGGNLAGTFKIKKNGAFGRGDVTVGPNEIVVFEDRGSNDDMIANHVGLYLQSSGSAYAVLTLNANVNETVGRLYLDGVRQPAGIYGSSVSTAQYKLSNWFSATGSGLLTNRDVPPGMVLMLK